MEPAALRSVWPGNLRAHRPFSLILLWILYTKSNQKECVSSSPDCQPWQAGLLGDKQVDWTVADTAGETGLQDNDGKLIFLPCDSFLTASGGLLSLRKNKVGYNV